MRFSELRLVAPTFDDTNCIMCTPTHGYLFVITEQGTRPISQAEAIDIFGPIDAPGEAFVVLGQPALVRRIGEGFDGTPW